MSKQGLTSHPTQYRSFRGQVAQVAFPLQVVLPCPNLWHL